MKLKKYTASSMGEAMKQIRAELGNDAVILNSKEVHTGGFLGLFKKKNMEVIAAIDPKTKEKQKPFRKEKQRKAAYQSVEPLKNHHVLDPSHTPGSIRAADMNEHELVAAISELKSYVKNLSLSDSKEGVSYPDPLKQASLFLAEQDIARHIREELLTRLLEKWYVNGAKGKKDEVWRWLRDALITRYSAIPFAGITFTKKFVNVVGPTGVGKTTTLAKLAADCVLKHKKKVAFITTDTYRIAAIDQLKTYAEILNVPLEVCYSLEDFRKAAARFFDYDLVLIDTAGRNFRNQQYVEELKQVIDYENQMESFLVLSLTSKQTDMEEIYKQFSIIGIDKFIFTKADETSTYGAMLNMVDKYKMGIAYLTNGQNVPDDIVAAEQAVIINTLFGVKT